MELKETSLLKKYNIKNFDKITYGWSSDEKYHLKDIYGNQFVLRLSAPDTFEDKQNDFRIIKKINKLDFNMSKVIEVGHSDELNKTFMIFSWVEGEMMSDQIANLSAIEQFRLGVEAGKILYKIHHVDVDKQDYPQKRRVEKKLKQLEDYISCSHRIQNDENVIDYIKENVHMIDDTPVVYKHGDFHLGNMVLSSDKKIGIIDFDRLGCGDGYDEFYKLQAFEIEVSIPFAIGKIKGYFGEEPPVEFWKIQKLYVAHSSLYSIKWAEEFGQKDVDGMIERYYSAAETYDNFSLLIPKWFTQNTSKFPLTLA